MKKLLLLVLTLILLGTACQQDGHQSNQTPDTPTETATLSSPTNTEASPSLTATLSTTARIEQARLSLEEVGAGGEFSGAVLIAYQGTPVFQAAYGLADLDRELPNQPDTKFNLGSLDKMFTAVAVMQLVEQDLLGLDSRIADLLPGYPLPDLAGAVTIHQLLTHTSGFGNYFDSPLYMEKFDEIRSLDDYYEVFADEEMAFYPGDQFGYSNSGYILLGLMIEAISGQSYYSYVQENIFEPAGMLDTACYELDAGTPNLAVGYTGLDEEGNETGQIHNNEFVLPMRGGSAGGGYSTAPDLLAFGNALLNFELLSPENTEILLEGKVDLREGVQYAYGFFDMLDEGYRRVGHGGGFPGICSMFNLYPDLGLAVVILSNSDADCLNAAEAITEALLR